MPLTNQVYGLQPYGFPHSDISGSLPVCGSPELFAAYHVFLRLRKPRHPPFALLIFLALCESYFTRFAYFEIVVRLSLRKNSYSLQTNLISIFSFFKPLNLSQYFQRTAAASQLRPLYNTKDIMESTRRIKFLVTRNPERRQVPAPKRRCSSHTFRYGYLVTT